MFQVRLYFVLVLVTLSEKGMCTTSTEEGLAYLKEALDEAVIRLTNAVSCGATECTSCGGCDVNCFLNNVMALKAEVEVMAMTTDSLKTEAAGTCSPCQYIPNITASGNPGFVVNDVGSNTFFVTDENGARTSSLPLVPDVRGLVYDQVLNKIWALAEPLLQYNPILSSAPPTPIPMGVTGSLDLLDVDANNQTLYFTQQTKVYKFDYGGLVLTELEDTGFISGHLRVDTCKNVLYWAINKGLKKMNLVGSPNVVKILDAGNFRTYGLDVDFTARKVYYCTFVYSRVFVLDLDTGVTTLLVQKKDWGNCYGLRLYNKHIYLAYSNRDAIYKRNLDGTFVEELLKGDVTGNNRKYFNIIA